MTVLLAIPVLLATAALGYGLRFVAFTDVRKAARARLYREAEEAGRNRLREERVRDMKAFDPTDPGTKVGYKPEWARPEGN